MKSALAEMVKSKYVTLVNFAKKNGIRDYQAMSHTLHFRRRDKSTLRALEKMGITKKRFEQMKEEHFKADGE